jgi:hypothetical protein
MEIFEYERKRGLGFRKVFILPRTSCQVGQDNNLVLIKQRKKEMEQPMAPWCWYQPSEKKKAMDE